MKVDKVDLMNRALHQMGTLSLGQRVEKIGSPQTGTLRGICPLCHLPISCAQRSRKVGTEPAHRRIQVHASCADTLYVNPEAWGVSP